MPATQDVLVSIVALGAAALIAWRVTGFFQPKRDEPGCGHCPSKPAATERDTHPLIFVKPPRS